MSMIEKDYLSKQRTKEPPWQVSASLLEVEISKLGEEIKQMEKKHLEIKDDLYDYLMDCGYYSLSEVISAFRQQKKVTLPEEDLFAILDLEKNNPKQLEELLIFVRTHQRPKEKRVFLREPSSKNKVGQKLYTHL